MKNDLISRQTAIDAVKEYFKFSPLEGRQCAKAIERVPSTQLDVPDTNVGELISRQEAISLIKEYERDSTCPLDYVSIIRQVPSVPRKGKWKRHFDGNEWYWYCSSCKEQWYEEDLWMGGNSFPNFCPNCGCRMEEGDSE